MRLLDQPLVTVEEALDQLWAIVATAVEDSSGGWSGAVAAAVATFMAAVDADRDRAWLCLAEPVGDGRRAGAARTAFKDRLVVLLGDEQRYDDDRPPSRTIAVGTVGSLWELAITRVSGRDEGLASDDVAASITFLALAPRLGRTAAMEQVLTAPKPSELDVVWPGSRSDDDA